MTTVLDRELLDKFEARLRGVGALIVDAWAPGLTDAEIDSLLLPLDVDLPEEARVWWRWHNGWRPDSSQLARAIIPGRWLTSLQVAAQEYEDFRDPMRDAGDPEGLVSPVGRKPTLYFHCSGPRDVPVPIYSRNDYTDPPRLVLPSIGELVLTWISYIDRDIFKTNADGSWISKPLDRYPPDVMQLGVA